MRHYDPTESALKVDHVNLVDWKFAVTTGHKLVRPGPPTTRHDARDTVAQLRTLAIEADLVVRDFTGMDAGDAEPVRVVDRKRWISANVDGFRFLLEPLLDKLAERRPPSVMTLSLGPKVTGAQIGMILAYLSQRVLGQYEIFLPPGQGAGRLTLVAPNIVEIERELGVNTRDFRMWVCLHEAAHRVQFTANPWLRDHLRNEIDEFLAATDLDPAAMLKRLKSVAAVVGDSIRGNGEVSLVEAVQTPEQKRILERVTAVMSLLEGHGEYVMNNVDAAVVPTSAEIHRKFDARRHQARSADRVIRQLFGLDLKMRQYAEGSAFVEAVVGRVGMADFNTIWQSPQTLPTRAEINDPDAWISRVLGAHRLTH
ncbi:MAG: hypothetical protein JWM93_1383 [Frankiales bacterium]|nr:hypothetical protein [Frankiales bacterium]